MAAGSRLCFTLIIALLLPKLARSYRPFKVPKNLFVHGTSPFTLPEGAHEIVRREDGAPTLETPEELVEDLRGQLRSRVRRDSPVPRQPEKGMLTLTKDFDTLYMYWPRNRGNESNIFLLAKNTKIGRDKTKSKVYVSRNYGKNFTDLGLTDKNNPPQIDQIYSSKADPQLCILADKVNKILYRSTDLAQFSRMPVQFVPSFITFHPRDRRYAMAYDSSSEKLYWSNNAGKNFTAVKGKIKSFHWGVEGIHSADTVFVEQYQPDRDSTKNNKTTIFKLVHGDPTMTKIVDSVEEFEVMKNYMFITTRKNPSDKNPILQVAKLANNGPISFKTAQFPLNEESRDFFVFDVVDNYVFIVINHLKNLSNLYISDTMGLKYQLSLPRVLYHNPYTDVSSPWLRTVIPYAFVDVDRIKGMRGIYVATQLTPGPVGKRHLLTLITYDRGGKWQRVRSPTVDNRGGRINCYLPSCSIHINLLYGAVYRVSPSERLFSSESAPGLVLALGVASTNLKIYPDVFMSLDGGLGWSRVLRGKYRFTFGDHGGVVVAVPYRRFTRTLRYTIDGGATWKVFVFSDSLILAQDVVTQPGERLPIFLIYGTNGQTRPWKVFYVNMTAVLGPKCNSTDYTQWTDGCLLGRQQQFETKNWTIHCHMTRDYKRPIYVKNCECTRDDFQCDYGFQRKRVDEECTPIRLGDDLNDNTIPQDCPEGSFYNKTRGFRKIPGDTCENGNEEDFMPVLTPCPVKELADLTLTCSNSNGDGTAAIATGQTASFSAAVGRGYMPNINFKWFFGDGHDGLTNNNTNVQHKYDKPGTYVVSVVASNTRSTLVTRIDLHVQDKLNEKQMSVTYQPKNPGVNENVILSASLKYSPGQVGHLKYKWKYDDGEFESWQAVATLQFKSSKTYNVSITAKNYVSNVTKIVQVNVAKDLTPINVVAKVLGPSRILVKWDPPLHADSSIKGYKVYKSTSAGGSYKPTGCESQSGSSCRVGSLTPATTYYFKVKASTTGGTGPFSIFAAATTNMTIPGMPYDLRAYPVNSAVINVKWKPPINPNGKITNYTIQYWSAAHPPTVKTINVGLNLSKNFTGLMQDTYYFFEVYAVSSAGRSAAAGPKQALTTLSKPTQAPRNLEKVSDNGTCAMLRWKAPILSKGDQRVFPAKGYKVQVNDSSINDAASAFKIVCNLNPGNIYTVSVWAYSEVGEGPKASISFITQTLKPGIPQNLHCSTPRGPDRVTLAWDPVQNSPGLSYEIYEESSLEMTKALDVKGEKTSYTVSSLLPYTKYKFSISAKNDVGSSARSPVVICQTSESVPGVVKYVTTETMDPPSATILITWSTPDPPNGEIKEYKITWGQVRHSQTEEITVHGSTHHYLFKNLFSNTAYTFIVKAKNGAGEAMQHQKPSVQRTDPASKGTERLQLKYNGANMDSSEVKSFIPEFIKAASETARISDRRLAAVVVKGHNVEFDLIPPLNATGLGMEEAKSALNKGFKVSDWMLTSGSLQRLFAYDGSNNVPTQTAEHKPGNKPTVGTQKGGSSGAVKGGSSGAVKGGSSDGSSKKTYLAIAVPLALLGLVLLGGLIFFYMKYKSLQKHYSQMGDQYHEDDEMKVVYHGEMEADSPDVIFSDRSRKGKKIYKDSEKIPLGDQDELSMI